MFGHTSSNKQYESNGLKDGELVDVLLLEHTYPKVYLDELKKHNDTEKERCEALGANFVPKEPSCKEAGIVWKYAVIFRSGSFTGEDDEPSEAVFKPTEEGLQEPRYICYGQVTLYTPEFLFNKGWNFQQLGGSVKANKSNKPYINEILPNAMVARDRDTGVKANAIPEGQEEVFGILIAEEKERIARWNEYTELWNNSNEEQCRKILDKWFSKMFMLCSFDIERSQYVYVAPEPGIKFRAKIEKDKYINLKIFKWNFEAKCYDYYSAFNTYEVEPEDLVLANKIKELRETMKLKREMAKSEKPVVNKDNYKEHIEDEDPPWDK